MKLFRFNKYFLIALINCFIFNDSLACSCSMGSDENKVQNAFSIFSGTVVSVKRLGSANMFGDENIVVEFDVNKSIKGGKRNVLHTAYNGMGCTGYWFKESQQYLIYTFERKDGNLDTMFCGGVTPRDGLEEKFDDIIKEVETLSHKINGD